MKFQSGNFYHIFNRGNNRQSIFPRPENYFFFLDKVKNIISPHCSIVTYCLMPNHFHLLIFVNINEDSTIPSGQMQVLERKIGTLQSSYTRAINRQQTTTGSLFQPKCRVLELDEAHSFACFHYIHQNPLKAGLCSKFEDWNFSSYKEYVSDSNNLICKREIAYELLRVPELPEEFNAHSKNTIIRQTFSIN